MNIVVVVAILLGIMIGFIIGCIPFVNEHLHWNFWFVIPISGLLIGAAIGGFQFMICYFFGVRVTIKTAIIFSLGSMVAYHATDVGTYLSLSIPIAEGDYKISSILSFSDYMSFRLGSSTIESVEGKDSFEIGATGTRLSFAVDILGAGLGAFGALCTLINQHPFCLRCGCYKKQQRIYSILPNPDEDNLSSVIGSIATLCQSQEHLRLVNLLIELESEQQNKESHIHIIAEELFCPKCREETIIGRIMRRNGDEWKEISELSFSSTSETA